MGTAANVTVEAASDFATGIRKKLENQLRIIWSQVNYCEDLETSSYALSDYLKKAKQIYLSYTSKDNHVTLIAERAKQQIGRQLELFFKSMDKIAQVQNSSQLATRRMNDINGENQTIVSELEKAFKLLENVSGKTKILAINANIEAARLGAQGAAFKVVAGEVQKLSDATGRSTQDITGTTKKIMDQSQEMVAVLNENQRILDESVSELTNVRNGFDSMNEELQAIVNESIALDDVFHEVFRLIEKAYLMVEYNRISHSNIKATLLRQAKEIEAILSELGQAVPGGGEASYDMQAGRNWYAEFYQSFKNEDVAGCVGILEEALRQGEDAAYLLSNVLERTVEKVGKEQIERDVPLSEIYLNGRIIEESLNLLLPAISAGGEKESLGKIVIGNAFGDYHALGRKIVATFLKMAGFDVVDLGLSVPNQTFVDVVKKEKAQLVCVSALIIHTAREIEKLRELLDQNGLRHVKILVGGAPFNFEPRLAEEVKADAMAGNGVEAIKVAKEMLGILGKAGAQ